MENIKTETGAWLIDGTICRKADWDKDNIGWEVLFEGCEDKRIKRAQAV